MKCAASGAYLNVVARYLALVVFDLPEGALAPGVARAPDVVQDFWIERAVVALFR